MVLVRIKVNSFNKFSCPCQYRVERDGEILGYSENVNFTDTANLEVGKRYIYTITTIDRNQRESSPVVCDNVIAVHIDPPPVGELLYFMLYCVIALIGLGLLTQLIRFIVKTREAIKEGQELNYLLTARKICLLCCGSCLRGNSKPLLELRQLNSEEKENLLDDDDSYD